jgi:SAM-dependent methyltransferase
MDLSLPRRVEPELLDSLGADDPHAQRSREDLRRIHRAMATLSVVKRALDSATLGSPPQSILELGAGDGSLLLRLAQRRAARWPGVNVTLLDRLDLVAPRTLDALRNLGWMSTVVTMDVFDWLARPYAARCDVILANLFIHHFSAEPLARLLAGIQRRCRVFFCCEPRRAALPLAGSHLIGLLGAGPVARKDAVSSVHAGFRGHELSELWPDKPAWVLHESSAGLFSHGFLAIRKSA